MGHIVRTQTLTEGPSLTFYGRRDSEGDAWSGEPLCHVLDREHYDRGPTRSLLLPKVNPPGMTHGPRHEPYDTSNRVN